MKLFEIISISRSGHHTILNWIFKNFVGFQCDWKYKLTAFGKTKMQFLSQGNFDIDHGIDLIQSNIKNIETLFVGYEDALYDYTIFKDDRQYRGPNSFDKNTHYQIDHVGRVLIIRNFFNVLSSRVKSNQEQIFKKWNTGEYYVFDVEKNFIEQWKNHAKAIVENKIPHIKFEDFLEKKEIRDKFLWDNFNIKDLFGVSEINGTGSSFGTRDKINERYKLVEIPDNIKKLVKNDNELYYLIGKLGYEYIEI